MTDEEWHKTMLAHLDKWLHWDEQTPRPHLLNHMWMNGDEFIEWRQTGIVPQVARICAVVWDDEIWNKVWGRSNR